MDKKIVYIDMDGVLCNYDKAFEEAIKNNPLIQKPQATFDFFRKMEPIDGAIEAVNWLLKNEIFDPFILTAPSEKNPLCYMEKRLWIGDHLGMEMVSRLIISPRKDLLKGDFLIDDMDSGKGQDKFEGELIHFGYGDVTGWEHVVDHLIQ